MNRYVLNGLLADLQDQKKVLVIAPTMTDAKILLDELAALAEGCSYYLGDNEERHVEVYRSAGNYRLVLRNGSIRIFTGRQNLRGYDPDVLVVMPYSMPSTHPDDVLGIQVILDRAEVIQL